LGYTSLGPAASHRATEKRAARKPPNYLLQV